MNDERDGYAMTDYAERVLRDGAGNGLAGASAVATCLALACAGGFGLGVCWAKGGGGVLPWAAAAVGLGLLEGVFAAWAYRAFRVASGFLLGLVTLILALAAAAAFLFGRLAGAGDAACWARLFEGTRGTVEVLAVAGTLFALPFVSAFTAASRAFFCEACGAWSTDRRTLPPLYLCVPEAAACALLAKGRISPLLSASPVASGSTGVALVVRLRFCPACRRGAMRVARAVPGGRPRRIAGLGRVPLGADAVRALLELAR